MTEEIENSHTRQECLGILIADDLTGACDAGVHFAHCGLTSVVELRDSAETPLADVRIVNSRSRHSTPDDAAAEVERLTRRLEPDARAMCFKKVDSTLRGNVVSESRAMMRGAGLEFAVLAPALPAHGRTVTHGVLRVQDCTGSWTTDICKLLARQGLEKCAVLSPGAAASPAKIAQEIIRLRASGAEFIVCDSEGDKDLESIAYGLLQLQRRPLWIGSAGLAKCAARILANASEPARSARTVIAADIALSDAPGADRRPRQTLFCVGSDHPVTLLQVKRLGKSGTVGALSAETATPREVREIMQAGRHVLLLLFGAPPEAERIRALIDEAKFEGIGAAFITGGATAEVVCDAIGAAAIRLKDEVSPGIPWGIFHGGSLDGLPVVTKAGGFGDEAALTNAAKLIGEIPAGAA